MQRRKNVTYALYYGTRVSQDIANDEYLWGGSSTIYSRRMSTAAYGTFTGLSTKRYYEEFLEA